MKQDPTARPDPNNQRKAMLAAGGVRDHMGSVEVHPIPNFDLDRTIFGTLKGTLARGVMASRVGKEPTFARDATERIAREYGALRSRRDLPEVDPKILRFMVEECDFDVEHADGSFLDHLYFGFEYCFEHYPEGSPTVMLLHSILGTGTNTFALGAEKIPALRALLNDEDWAHIEAFPSVLRLLYGRAFRRELDSMGDRVHSIRGLKLHRVIDNAPIELSATQFWEQLNYQLIHLVDFLPVANWPVHLGDTAFIVFRDLYRYLGSVGQMKAKVAYTPPERFRAPRGEHLSPFGWLATRIPVPVSERMAEKSVAQFSGAIGHSLDYSWVW
ncbi:MAG: hypothetical protein AAF411_09070 [Myxococcota bacterium]